MKLFYYKTDFKQGLIHFRFLQKIIYSHHLHFFYSYYFLKILEMAGFCGVFSANLLKR